MGMVDSLRRTSLHTELLPWIIWQRLFYNDAKGRYTGCTIGLITAIKYCFQCTVSTLKRESGNFEIKQSKSRVIIWRKKKTRLRVTEQPEIQCKTSQIWYRKANCYHPSFGWKKKIKKISHQSAVNQMMDVKAAAGVTYSTICTSQLVACVCVRT